MSGNIYDMIEKTPEQLKSETQEAEKKEASNSGGNGGKFEEPVYQGINLDIDTIQRNTKRYYVQSEVEMPDDIKATLDRVIDRLNIKEWVLRINPEDRRNLIAKHAYVKAAWKEVFLPWASMNHAITPLIKKPTVMAHRVSIWIEKQLFKSDEDKYNALQSYFKAFKANYTHIILGEKCNSLIDFAIIYTPCGSTSLNKDTDYKTFGYENAKLVRLAKLLEFRVFNLGSNDSVMELEQYLSSVVEGNNS